MILGWNGLKKKNKDDNKKPNKERNGTGKGGERKHFVFDQKGGKQKIARNHQNKKGDDKNNNKITSAKTNLSKGLKEDRYNKSGVDKKKNSYVKSSKREQSPVKKQSLLQKKSD